VGVRFDTQGNAYVSVDGEQYPDFEAIQYRQHAAPRSVGWDCMSDLREMASAPNIDWSKGLPPLEPGLRMRSLRWTNGEFRLMPKWFET
jgi:hypothetical protein